MRCQRCNVVMVNERFYGPGDPFWGWRCMLCGNISDPIILENRSQRTALAAKGREKKNKYSEMSEKLNGNIFKARRCRPAQPQA
jgi:hypothetical protein